MKNYFTQVACGLFLCLIGVFPAMAQTETVLYDEAEVNGHPGFLTAWSVHGELDRVVVIVPGFDTENVNPPLEQLQDDFGEFVDFLGAFGWDVVMFEYVDGAQDLKANANNLARFLEYLDSQVGNAYHLAILSGSMGGIVTRTMFVQEDSNMGVDTYVAIDAPHWGVYLSRFVEDLIPLAEEYPAALQMTNGHPDYKEHYRWLRRVERNPAFHDAVIAPMNTCAIALSDGTRPWKVDWQDLIIHNKYYPVASFVEESGFESTYMPYHSTVKLDRIATYQLRRGGFNRYKYRSLESSYFDETIANPRAEHGAPEEAVLQAVNFILENAPE